MTTPSPFKTKTNHTLVAISGRRAGYIQLAPSLETSQHANVPEHLFQACQTWCAFLQTQSDVSKVYWLQFSEVVPHLHWHLFPRFETDALKGTALFEARNDVTFQTKWPDHWKSALAEWARRYDIAVIDECQTP